MQKSATKCNEIIGKWCKNKHGASKIIDTFETYHWAGSGGTSLAGNPLQAATSPPRLGRIIVFRPGQAGIPDPGRIIPFVGRDIHSWAGLLPSRADIYHLRNIFLVQHQLQRIVPVLGRLQARTGTSSIVVCWSWDAPWLR
jgi:hypothetical protein